MKHKRYSSINNAYREKTVNAIRMYFPNNKFVVQEKVHGSNFAFYYADGKVRVGKRSSFVDDDNLNSFYNCEKVVRELEQNVLNMGKELGVPFIIYGELHGGSYPHNDVAKLPGKAVQNGVFYSNELKFIAFDIRIDEFVSFEDFTTYCEKFDIPYLPALKVGTLEECLEYPNEFITTLPERYGLPEIEDNICEGVVIKPIQPLRFMDQTRVILKNKNERWSEKKKNKQVKERKPVEWGELAPYVEEITSYVTENRLRNVISNAGELDDPKKIFNTLITAMNKDVSEDFLKDNEAFLELDKKERTRVLKEAGRLNAQMIRENYIKIVNGTF